MKRVFLIVLDSFGIGEMPDAKNYGDEGSNTLAACATSQYFSMPNMKKLGLFNIDGVTCRERADVFDGAIARMKELSGGKDTTVGHWEIAGLVSPEAMPTFKEGFPDKLLKEFSKRTGRGVICNLPYSGTKVLEDFGEEHMKTGDLIVYTSADSVFQVAAHEDIVPIEILYQYCEIARELCQGEYGVGRVIARPFIGEVGSFTRTSRRHDYSLIPPRDTMLDCISKEGKSVLSVGKIIDIFAQKGITNFVRTSCNEEGIQRTIEYMDQDFEGLCFTNLVDYDMLYGHRNDVDGYAKALKVFDDCIPELISHLKEDDILMITADHGCDPITPSTDHSREYTPLLIYGDKIRENCNLGTREGFCDIAATICDYLGVEKTQDGNSFLSFIEK